MSNNNNNGKVAVVTGSSRGIGKAIANQFVKNGYILLFLMQEMKVI